MNYDNDYEGEDDNGDEDDNDDDIDNHVVVHRPKANRWVNSGLAVNVSKGTLHILCYIYSDFVFLLLYFT